MGLDRQEKALREFKQILDDLVYLLRTSTGVETAYLCWVNRERQQFVWETNTTTLPNVMFQDRIAFENNFLNEFKDLTEPVSLTLKVDLPENALTHYFDFVPVEHLVIIPFINRGETVALTVIESKKTLSTERLESNILAYNNALVNVLNTYLEVVDLHQEQKEWESYESQLQTIDYKNHRVEIIARMINQMQTYLKEGAVSFVTRGMETWNVVLNSDKAISPPPLGLTVQEKSLCYEALDKGKAVFNMHFNNSPRKFSSKENHTQGASMAVPLLIHERRQGVVLVNDNNPLVFNESVKHKISNLVRVAGLSIQSVSKKEDENDLFVNEYGAYVHDLWEQTLGSVLKRGTYKRDIWFGLITPENLSELRTKFGVNELARIQKDLVAAINPANAGFSGFIGFNTDYVYPFIIESSQPDCVQTWIKSLSGEVKNGLKLSNGNIIDIAFKAGFVKVIDGYNDAYQVLGAAKQALSDAVKADDKELVQG